jgi:hypothetical protein
MTDGKKKPPAATGGNSQKAKCNDPGVSGIALNCSTPIRPFPRLTGLRWRQARGLMTWRDLAGNLREVRT